MAEMAVSRLMTRFAGVDIAVEAFRRSLPTYGFKLVVPPPVGCDISAFASVWRRGDAAAVSHRGGSAALALLRAAERELARIQDDAIAEACGRCRGLGWHVTNAGGIETCDHREPPKRAAT
jgi:hypothetical protein